MNRSTKNPLVTIASTRSTIAATLLALCWLLPFGALAAGSLPTATLSIAGNRLTAEIAATPDERATGLMHRFSLQTDHGMLFVFERAETLHFWMKNTFIPLSIAFIATDGKILNIEDMAPQTETTHASRGPALYALEMRKGWFAQRGIRAGDTVEGIGASRLRK